MITISSVVLVGLKHVGKSTLAAIAAKTLGMLAIDLDSVIVELSEDCSTAREVYRRYGKEGFVDLEVRATMQTLETARRQEAIVSTGGGIADNDVALTYLKTSRIPTLYLFERPLVLYERVQAGGIPAFLDATRPREHFLELADTRDRIYRSVAGTTIDVHGLSVSEAATRLIDEIRRIHAR